MISFDWRGDDTHDVIIAIERSRGKITGGVNTRVDYIKKTTNSDIVNRCPET